MIMNNGLFLTVSSLLPPTLTKYSEHCHSNHHKIFNAEWHVIITNNKLILPSSFEVFNSFTLMVTDMRPFF